MNDSRLLNAMFGSFCSNVEKNITIMKIRYSRPLYL